MESWRIPILENFGLISKIMPYYNNTHNSFQVLSSLSSRSRKKLDEYYTEFIYFMKNYRFHFNMENNPNILSYPSDLISMTIVISNKNKNVF